MTDYCGSVVTAKLQNDGGQWNQIEYRETTGGVNCTGVTACTSSTAFWLDETATEKWYIEGAGQNNCRRSGVTPRTWVAGSYPPSCGSPEACLAHSEVCVGGTPACYCYSQLYRYYEYGCA